MAQKEQLNVRIDKELKDLINQSEKSNPEIVREALELYFYGNQQEDNNEITNANKLLSSWVHSLQDYNETLKEQLKEKDNLINNMNYQLTILQQQAQDNNQSVIKKLTDKISNLKLKEK